MKQTIIFKQDLEGNVIRVKGRTHRASRELEDFDTRMVKSLYTLECEQGSRFNGAGEFSPKFLKKHWIDNKRK